jgi:hypothetical protein
MFYVVRTHSHTDRQQLWKVESRPMHSRDACESWKNFCESEYREEHPKGKHKFFVIEQFT